MRPMPSMTHELLANLRFILWIFILMSKPIKKSRTIYLLPTGNCFVRNIKANFLWVLVRYFFCDFSITDEVTGALLNFLRYLAKRSIITFSPDNPRALTPPKGYKKPFVFACL